MSVKCPVCKRQWKYSMQVARHVFGTTDKAHEAWMSSQGPWFRGLLIQETAPSGKCNFLTLPEIIEQWQNKI